MLAENLYRLRRQRGLSQEQLAQELGVSRQAISKWEQSSAMPESEKLVLIAQFFGVTLDQLVNDLPETPSKPYIETEKKKSEFTAGLLLCGTGILGLLFWGLFSLFAPKVSEQISEASTIQIDGNGIFLLLCIGALVAGAVVLLKQNKDKEGRQ